MVVQTYEDAGEEVIGVVEPIMGAPPTKSSSKSSLRSDNEQYYEAAPRHNEEMSEKAMMRYARKARNKEQHYQKLKRSLSTQLNYPGAEAWMDSVEGRHFYRSSSRQSLMDDTRVLLGICFQFLKLFFLNFFVAIGILFACFVGDNKRACQCLVHRPGIVVRRPWEGTVGVVARAVAAELVVGLIGTKSFEGIRHHRQCGIPDMECHQRASLPALTT